MPLWNFLTDTQWTPLFDDAHFGIVVLLSGTITSAFVALLSRFRSAPSIAIYLSEFATPRAREIAKPILELLAGVPTIVYGYFALLFVTPILQKLIPSLPGFNLLSAGIVMGIMIVPYVASISEDAMRAVPMALREGSFAMGATRLQTATQGRHARGDLGHRGRVHPGHLARSRRNDDPRGRRRHAAEPHLQPAEAAATITAYIVQVALGDLPHGSIGYQTIFAAGLTLLLLTLFFNLIGFWMRKRYREVY